MLKKIKAFFICTLILSIIIWIVAFIISQKYLIRGFSLLYPIYGMVFSVAFLFINEKIKKVESKRVGQVVISSLIAFGTFVGCFVIYYFKEMFISSGELYAVSVENLPAENEIYLYEYQHLTSNEGMLCVKKNDIFYLKLKETIYLVEPNHTLSDPENMSLSFDKETGVLTMKYRWSEGSEYYGIETIYPTD